ncbi:Hypothetical predicted protein, partial [Pelobates cultripes]
MQNLSRFSIGQPFSHFGAQPAHHPVSHFRHLNTEPARSGHVLLQLLKHFEMHTSLYNSSDAAL